MTSAPATGPSIPPCSGAATRSRRRSLPPREATHGDERTSSTKPDPSLPRGQDRMSPAGVEYIRGVLLQGPSDPERVLGASRLRAAARACRRPRSVAPADRHVARLSGRHRPLAERAVGSRSHLLDRGPFRGRAFRKAWIESRSHGNHDPALIKALHWSRLRRVLVQGEVCSGTVVVEEIVAQQGRRWASFSTTMWSRHSRRRVPMSRSTYGFCQGDLGAVHPGAPRARRAGQSTGHDPRVGVQHRRHRRSAQRVLSGRSLGRRDDSRPARRGVLHSDPVGPAAPCDTRPRLLHPAQTRCKDYGWLKLLSRADQHPDGSLPVARSGGRAPERIA
jgi:hypothetical protein